MVAGMRSYLAAAGLDVAEESLRGSLVLSSDRDYLIDDRRFDLEGMMQSLQDALKEAFANAQCEAPEVDSLIDPILEPQGLA
jgi:H2-forming N5,N10-methylenetetrahydromethanopterin dehydrogenase-like enzyme